MKKVHLLAGFAIVLISIDSNVNAPIGNSVHSPPLPIGNSVHSPPLVIFYHLALVGTYVQRNARIMEYIDESRLLDFVQNFFVVVVGNLTANPLPKLPTRVSIIDGGTDVTKWEWPTLNQLYKYAQKSSDSYILYIHDKGATHQLDEQPINDWIDLLLFFNVHHWRAATQYLANYQVVCINFATYDSHPHCSGNFWWARADYIITLNAPLSVNRLDYQYWIGTQLPPVNLPEATSNEACILWPETVAHYGSLFPPEKYNVTDPHCMLTYPACIPTKCRIAPNINF